MAGLFVAENAILNPYSPHGLNDKTNHAIYNVNPRFGIHALYGPGLGLGPGPCKVWVPDPGLKICLKLCDLPLGLLGVGIEVEV